MHPRILRLAIAAVLFFLPLTAFAQLDENCVVTILNRVSRVQPDGRWSVSNVPSNVGRTRARATCQRNGVTTVGQSDYFVVPITGSVSGIRIRFDDPKPVPAQLAVTAPHSALAVGETTQLAVTITWPDASTSDGSAPAAGTNYRSSSPATASVSDAGLVTALAPGASIISATNEGTLALFRVVVSGSTDQDNDGMADDWELANGFDPNDPSDANGDADNDGLTNRDEHDRGTGPRNVDSDGDGVADGLEVATGSNPIDPSSYNLAQILTSIALSPSRVVLGISSLGSEATQQLRVTGTMTDGRTLDLTAAVRGTTYTSSNLTICGFANINGRISATGNTGTCTITASNNGHTATAQVEVQNFVPGPLSQLVLPDVAWNVKIAGAFAFVANGAAGFTVVDIADKYVPVIATTLPLPGIAQDVRMRGRYAYVASGTAGLHVIDILDPRAPHLVTTLDTPGDARDVFLDGDYAYVADGASGLQVISIANPAAPVLTGTLATSDQANGVAVNGNLAIVVTGVTPGTCNVVAVNVQNAASPVLLDTLALPGEGNDVALRDTYAFVAAGSGGLQIVDMTTPSALEDLSSLPPTFRPVDVLAGPQFAFFAETAFLAAIAVADISDPQQPVFNQMIPMFPPVYQQGHGLDADATYLYLAAGTRLFIGQYAAVVDEAGIAPTVQITTPAAGATFIENDVLPLAATASDDVGVATVTFSVTGASPITTNVPNFHTQTRVPSGITSMTIDASATDFAGNVGHATPVVCTVIPDPHTTVAGVIHTHAGAPAVGVVVTAFDRSATTDASGAYAIADVSTIDGEISVSAEWTVASSILVGWAGPATPVRGGITTMPDMTLGVAPTAQLTSPEAGGLLVPGDRISITVDGTDADLPEGESLWAMLSIQGEFYDSDWPPFTRVITVPSDITTFTATATVMDSEGNTTEAAPLTWNVGSDPGTTVHGIVKTASGTPVAGATVRLLETWMHGPWNIAINSDHYPGTVTGDFGGTYQAVTNAAGEYEITGMPTAKGDFVARATKPSGTDALLGWSDVVHPVRGGVTNVADIVVSGTSSTVAMMPFDERLGAFDVQGRLIAVSENNVVRFIDFTNPAVPHAVGALTMAEDVNGVTLDGTRAFITSRDGLLSIADVTDPANASITGSVTLPTAGNQTAIAGSYAYVATSWGVSIVDITTPAEPAVASNLIVGSGAKGIAVSGSKVLILENTTGFSPSTHRTGFSVVDVSNPAEPVIDGRVVLVGYAERLLVGGNLAYVSIGTSLVVIDFSTPAEPVIAGTAPLQQFAPSGIALHNDTMFACGIDQTGTTSIASINVATASAPAEGARIAVESGGRVDGYGLEASGSFLIMIGSPDTWDGTIGLVSQNVREQRMPAEVETMLFIVRMPGGTE